MLCTMHTERGNAHREAVHTQQQQHTYTKRKREVVRTEKERER